MLNVCCFCGVLGKDARLVAGANGDFVSFSLAVSQGKKKDGTFRDSLWINCTGSSISEKLVPYLTKKTVVEVVGALKPIRTTEGKDGQEYHSIELSVFQVHLVSSAEPSEEDNAVNSNNTAPARTLGAADISF